MDMTCTRWGSSSSGVAGNQAACVVPIEYEVADGAVAIPATRTIHPFLVGKLRFLCKGAAKSRGIVLQRVQADRFEDKCVGRV